MEEYKIIKPLGSGGNCNAFLGKEISSGKLVTIKKRKTEDSNFFNESVILEELDHKSVPSLYKRSSEELILEYIPGKSLEKILIRKGLFTEKEAMHIAYELAGIMRYLHGRRKPVIYRDLKPSNIVMKPDGHICLIDFGAARFYEAGEASDTLNLGTLGFAAPEQYGNLGQTDPRTDIYCFGMTILQLVSGVDTKDTDEVASFKKNGIKGISDEFIAVVDKCTRADREDRFRSFREIQEELEVIPKRKKTKKFIGMAKVVALAAVLSVIISVGIINAEEVTSYATNDFTERMPAVRMRFSYARSWIEDFLKENEVLIK
ncbi:serine/threonine protein kinase [Butyrivibrio proteoclasticus]|uniref:serine/threonine protein kinase n=1 Tax=Butyrivibrio proteoclasticus TaxID=43305 RepID=UPI000478E3B7|nr:serine/threonine-protein kinase [Butyrivibrio proteoclasticus]